LIVHGTNDADVLFHHPKHAALTIPKAEVFLVIGGFHLLSLSSNVNQITEKKTEFLKKHSPETAD
jgi:metal-dependent hydrolase (beta-lactamase superfamily II)